MNNEILIYKKNGQSIDVRWDAKQETLWLMHLKNTHKDNELDGNATTKDFLVVRQRSCHYV
ncbi:MAG: hypothetical protein JKY76_01045 [Proteobacteria bacterium]|nr:hypothetical protein [Pseudomonadota bacterium]